MRIVLITVVIFLIIVFEIFTGGLIKDTYNPFRMEYTKNELKSFLKHHRDPKDSFIFYDVNDYYYLDYSPLLLPFNLKKIKIKKDLVNVNTPLIDSKVSLVRECREFIIFEDKDKNKKSLKDCIY